ncbi:MAG: ATP-dependent DNA helicase RecG [bacterium]|nr:ATP-dependent DNA helicase RecG [bacterium]
MDINEPLSKIFRLRDEQQKALGRLKIRTILDLLLYVPTRYSDPHTLRTVSAAPENESVSIAGKIISITSGNTWANKRAKAQALVEDVQGTRFSIIWFSQPYMAKYLAKGDIIIATGTLAPFKGGFSMINPAVQQTGSSEVLSTNSLFESSEAILLPVYPETKGISSRWLHEHAKKLIAQKYHELIADPIPKNVRSALNLPELKSAIVWAHNPKKINDAVSAKKRFSFAEIFCIQVEREQVRALFRQQPGLVIARAHEQAKELLNMLPFTPTNAQLHVIQTICNELQSNIPMCRLLEGDVGSGKTLVAAAASYAVLTGDHAHTEQPQVAVLAPTEILARQHLETFIELFKHTNIKIGFLAGSGCFVYPSKISASEGTKISKRQLNTWITEGNVRLVIGTHALIQKNVTFKRLALAVIDEQHRFGITQRKSLVANNEFMPHLLSMTATPIPRTLALTIFGDLDISVLDELPKGRKKQITEIIFPKDRTEHYASLVHHLERGNQIFVVCPRIDRADPDNELSMKAPSATEVAEELNKLLPDFNVTLLHSKLSAAEKTQIMSDFSQHRSDVLVSTSVVEVGVDIPNATVMVIEAAERFGLAQLHQLRGRVGRGTDQAYCYLVPNTTVSTSLKRLTLLTKTNSGFTLAEFDLMNRGSGSLTEGKQWGVSDIAMEALKNLKLVEVAKRMARELVQDDPTIKNYAPLRDELTKMSKKLHLE